MARYMPRYQIVTLYLLVVLALLVVAFYEQHQAAMVNQDSYARCQDRSENINKLNAYYEARARLDMLDTTTPLTLRQQYADLDRAQVFAAPKCGKP